MKLSSLFGKKEAALKVPFDDLRTICIGGISHLGKFLINANVSCNYNVCHLFFAHLDFASYRYINIMNHYCPVESLVKS